MEQTASAWAWLEPHQGMVLLVACVAGALLGLAVVEEPHWINSTPVSHPVSAAASGDRDN